MSVHRYRVDRRGREKIGGHGEGAFVDEAVVKGELEGGCAGVFVVTGVGDGVNSESD